MASHSTLRIFDMTGKKVLLTGATGHLNPYGMLSVFWISEMNRNTLGYALEISCQVLHLGREKYQS
jgi:hypothetical protein